jgi:hypothetical protein
MEDLPEEVNGSPESPDAQPEHPIGRRRMLKLLAAAGGAAAAALALPETWSEPTAEAAEVNVITRGPVLYGLFVDGLRQARFSYLDPLGGVKDNTTLMGVSFSSCGRLRFNTFAGWRARRIGTSKMGTIRFPVTFNSVPGTIPSLAVQLRIFPTVFNGSPPGDNYRATNVAYWPWPCINTIT